MTVEQNLAFGLSHLPRTEARERIAALVRRAGLTGLEKRYPHQLSGGEARRAAIVRTLAPRPAILLMDEPLTNLNTELKSDLLQLIKEYAAENKATLIYVTHDAGEAATISNRVLLFKDGRLEEN